MVSLSILREAPAHIFSISLNRQNIYLCYGKPTNDCPVLFTIAILIHLNCYGWHDNLQSKDTLNYVSLVAKYFIFCRIQDNASVNFDSFPAFLKTRIDTLKQIALRNKQLDNFYIKWKNFI